MPTYEYSCNHCGHLFEKFQGINDAVLDTCPECGGRIRRLFSGGGAVLIKNRAPVPACAGGHCSTESPCYQAEACGSRCAY